MEWYEIRAALKYSYYSYKDVWEANRLTAYLIAQTNSNVRIELSEIVTFPWEKKKDKEDTSISKEDIERLKLKSEQYLKHKENG